MHEFFMDSIAHLLGALLSVLTGLIRRLCENFMVFALCLVRQPQPLVE